MAPVRQIRRRDCRGTTHDALARERAPLSPSGVVSEAQIRPVEPTRTAVSHREDDSWEECLLEENLLMALLTGITNVEFILVPDFVSPSAGRFEPKTTLTTPVVFPLVDFSPTPTHRGV